jgi:hypothetical protein
MFGNRPDGTSYLEYYRGEKGQFIKGIPGNILERYQELATNPDLRTNFLFSNLYVDEESLNPLSREVVFSIRNIETSEYAKEYREAFLEGMNHADEKVRNFFKDLALGSFMQNGAHFNQGKVSTVVPFEAYIDLTADAYNKLMDMKKNNPEAFGNYLSLVGFNTSIKVNSSDSLLLPLPSFLSAYSPISIDMMGILNPELVSKVQILENKVREAVTGQKTADIKATVPTQPTTNVTADVILPIGTSGSGKSTFIKSLPQENLVVIEPDAMRVEFTGDINDKSKDKEIYTEAAKRAIEAVKNGKQVVFDTTNLTKDKR